MIAVDTNVLARFYVDDPSDRDSLKQRAIAQTLLAESKHIFVPITVVLELVWVLRSFYSFTPTDCDRVFSHLIGLENVEVQSWDAVLIASRLTMQGLDFADALHLALSNNSERFATFDDKAFARRAQKLKLVPSVFVPSLP